LRLLCRRRSWRATRLRWGGISSPLRRRRDGARGCARHRTEASLLNDRRVDDYLSALGRRLASKAPGERYPYQFKAVNDPAINAFALPGGFLYVNRGTIEAAQDEAQLAGVIGHEIGHVALRHGTNQATKSYAAQVPLRSSAAALGSNSIGAVLAQIGAEFAADSVLLKYSRDAERQPTSSGPRSCTTTATIPARMAQFFEILNRESKGGRGPDWFSSHSESREPDGESPGGGPEARGPLRIPGRLAGVPRNQALRAVAPQGPGAFVPRRPTGQQRPPARRRRRATGSSRTMS